MSLFSGIGSFEKALDRLNINYELIGFSEIDKYAIKSYCIIHNVSENKNLGDIRKININELEDFDLLTWGFPCQDITLTGKMKGIKKETRSGLYFEGYKILKEKMPRYSIIENVKNLTSKRFKKEFESILNDIEMAGYNNYWKILNAKDYGIPQNRERLFIVSVRKDIDKKDFVFPCSRTLTLKLKDLLEENVDEKFYLKEKSIGKLVKRENSKYNEFYNTKINNSEKQEYVLIRENTKKGYTEARLGDSINYSYPNCMTKRGRVGKEVAQTILTSPTIATLIPIDIYDFDNHANNISSVAILISEDGKHYFKLRRLTVLECYRLMGFSDIDYYKIKSISISDTQAYKTAGNSIVVNVLEAIFRELLKEEIRGMQSSLKENKN